MKKISLIVLLFLLSPLHYSLAQSVDLLWQGEGYTQPFYKGKTLWGYENLVTIQAIPQSLGGARNLNFRWSRNGTILGNVSGVGKDSITLRDSVLSKPQRVGVEVVSAGGDVLAQSTINLAPRAPELSVYENNPLYGVMFHKEVGGSYKLNNDEVTLEVFPLFFATNERAVGNLQYSWKSGANDKTAGPTVTYRIPEGGSGVSRVEVGVENSSLILQSSKRNFLIQFGNDN